MKKTLLLGRYIELSDSINVSVSNRLRAKCPYFTPAVGSQPKAPLLEARYIHIWLIVHNVHWLISGPRTHGHLLFIGECGNNTQDATLLRC